MEIIHYNGKIIFDQISVGTVFTEKEKCYIKIPAVTRNNGSILRNTVNLKTGELHYVPSSTEVIPYYSAQLILK